MGTERHAPGQGDAGDGRRGEILRVEHVERRDVGGVVVAEHQDPALVLGRVRSGRREHRLEHVGAGTTEGMDLRGPGLEVVAEDISGERRRRPRDEAGHVPVPGRDPDPTVVDPREVTRYGRRVAPP